jgi:spore coat polysaccharide biosynthesis protein SpsF
MSTNTAIIVQARMTSTRLPGKVLLPIAGRPMLTYLLERLRRVQRAGRTVVATTTNAADDPIVSVATACGVACTRGPELDVLARFAQAAEQARASVVVRVTADCPLLDPALVDNAIDTFLHAPVHYDYVSNMLEPSYPYGMAVEVFSAAALAAASAEATEDAEREHVTPFIYWRPERFKLRSLTMRPNLSSNRWTVDTKEDFELVSRIVETLYPRNPEFRMADVLDLLDQHSDWRKINRGVRQKNIEQEHPRGHHAP